MINLGPISVGLYLKTPLLVAKATEALMTPGRALMRFSMVATHDVQVMPVICGNDNENTDFNFCFVCFLNMY